MILVKRKNLGWSATFLLIAICALSEPRVFVIDESGNVNSTGLPVSFNSSLSVNTLSLAQATVGVAYSVTLQASGGTAPLNWSLISGSLPPGLVLDAALGTVSGTPTSAGLASFQVRVIDSGSRISARSLSLTVQSAGGGTPSSGNDLRPAQQFLAPGHASGGNVTFGSSAMEVKIHDFSGNVVFEKTKEGSNNIVWDGRDTGGRVLESGLYVCKITGSSGAVVYHQVVIVK